jgi:hypothetical protein
MIGYICPYCDKFAFYLKKRIYKGDRLTYQNVYTNENWTPKYKGDILCQNCMRHLYGLVVERIMNNLEYLEYTFQKKGLKNETSRQRATRTTV